MDNLLLVAADKTIEALAREIATSIYSADDTAEAIEIARNTDLDSIVIGPSVPLETACSIVRQLSCFADAVPVIAVGEDGDAEELRQRFRKAGGTEYLRLADASAHLARVLRQLHRASSQAQPAQNTPVSPSFQAMIGNSPAMDHARRMIRLVAESGCDPVLILGETGTGKELAARSVHELRCGNDNSRFVAINCAALTASLLESELFGHVKGSFTGADSEKTGLLELAGKGTVFLDEISEMPLELQAKLLRVLQERTFRKVGGTSEIPCNATIIASSNRNLLKEVNEHRFRRDLYYRLSVCPVTLQPLRSEHRRQDIPILAEHFLKVSDICPRKNTPVKGITQMALEALNRHNWPGNVRELKNVIDRAILLETGERISCDSIVIHRDDIGPEMATAIERPITDFSLEKAEQELITRALRETGWRKSRAASLLGITRATLYAKVKQYSIQPTTGEPCEAMASAGPRT